MKRLICILFAALLLCACTTKKDPAQVTVTDPSEPPAPAEIPDPAELPDFPVPEITGYTGFADVLAAKLVDGTKNRNLSPISVYLALAMTAEGAKGETQTAMLKLLGCQSLEELRGVCGTMLKTLSVDGEDNTLTFANSIWLGERDVPLQFRENYLKTLADVYRSEANAVRFGKAETSKQIADWITEHTHGKIKVSENAMQFDVSTVAVLINTIYLKSAWVDEFYEGATETGTFFGLDDEQTVSYMNRKDSNAEIVEGDGFLRYSLALRRIGRMTFILPDEGTPLNDLLGSPEQLAALLRGGEALRADVSVKLPKFKFQDAMELASVLQSLGIGIAFTDDADFTGMVESNAAISRVLQESFVGVDENGVEAAAYTMVAVEDSCAMPPEDLKQIDFHLTRPFLYVIESYDGTVLFIGTVTEPTPAS